MKLTDQQIEILSAYFEGELTEAEQLVLERQLEDDEDFRNAAAKLRLLTKSLDDYRHRDQRAKFAQWDKEIATEQLKPKGKVINLNFYLRIAAVLLPLMAIGYWLFMSPPADSYVAIADDAFSKYEKNSKLSTLSGGDLSGYEYFDLEKYPEAVRAFEQALGADPGNQLLEYYLGLSYLGNKQSLKAIPLLKKHVSNQNINTDDCKWFLALAYLRSGSEPEAKSILLELSSLKESPGPEANLLIQKIH